MPICRGCGAGACTCELEAGTGMTITGTGAPGDPFIISATAPPAASIEDLAVFFRTGTLTVAPGVSRFKFPFPVTLINVTAAVNTAPTGADIILDVNLNGVTIFTTQANRPRILAGTFQETVDAVPDITAVANDQYLQVDVDAVGSIIPGSDLTVFVRYSRP